MEKLQLFRGDTILIKMSREAVNRKLNAMNKLLMEENDRLQKQVSRLVYENGHMKQQLHTVRFHPRHSEIVASIAFHADGE